jgi:hypothetical protein
VIVPLTVKATAAVAMEESVISKSLFVGKIDAKFVSVNLYIEAIANSGYDAAIGVPQVSDNV